MATFTVRIPDALHERIKAAAAADRRSMNGEVEWLLTAALDMREPRPGSAPGGKEDLR